MKSAFLIIVTIFLSACVATQPSPLPLSEYEGLYEYENDTTLIIVAGPKRELLYADINGARYPLKPSAPDIFLNAGNVEVEFVRDSQNRIIGYRENKSDKNEENAIFKLLDAALILPSSIWVAKPETAITPYEYMKPSDLLDGLSIRTPGADSELTLQLSAMTNAIYGGAYPNTHSVLVYRDGALVFEEYFYDFDRETTHQLRSATKTLIAILAGIAVDQGLISTIQQPVLPYFDEYDGLQNVDKRKRFITIADLLTMQSGFACNDWESSSPGNENTMIYTDDWARFILDLPMSDEPGTVGSYCSGNVILLGRIIEITSGMALKDYANEFLFGPLGIRDYQWDFRPDRSNINNFVQAWLRPRDLMKIGVLLNDSGVWDEKQIVSAAWIENLTGTQSKIGDTPYGYFFWGRYIFPDGKQRIEIPQMSGNGGQKVILLKKQNAIVVLTGGNYNQQSHTNELLADYILKGFTD